MKIDYKLLKKQKRHLVRIINGLNNVSKMLKKEDYGSKQCEKDIEALNGILHLIDAIEDSKLSFKSIVDAEKEVLSILEKGGVLTQFMLSKNDIENCARDLGVNLTNAQINKVISILEKNYVSHIGVNYTNIKEAIRKVMRIK